MRSALLSSGGLHLIGWLSIEVLPDSIVVYCCSRRYKHVPDGMSEWNNAITFEEDHAQTVEGPTHQQLVQPRLLRLGRGKEFTTG